MAAMGELASGTMVDGDEMRREAVVEMLGAAGIEIYRESEQTVQLAERVRMHLMDSGVGIELEAPVRVVFAIRCQRSDHPGESPDGMYERVRQAHGEAVTGAGFCEQRADARQVTDPMDDTNVLDVWYEVHFAREVTSLDDMREAASWALAQRKCID